MGNTDVIGRDDLSDSIDASLALEMAARPTMRQVARRAGVSLKTVSRVVNGEPGVAAATARRVQDALETLNFRPNDLARSLRQGTPSLALGFIIQDLANPFYSTLARAVEDVARQRDVALMLASSEGDRAREREMVESMLRRRVDGLLLVTASTDHAYLAREIALGTPVVFVDRPPLELDADAVLFDNRSGARQAVGHLLRRGHRRIGVLSDANTIYTFRERVDGYHEALTAWGAPVDPHLARIGLSTAEHAQRATLDLLALAEPPTALFATNNRMSLGALRAMRSSGQQVALVGFDDFELADLLPVPVTVVAHDPALLGRRAAELLFARLDGDRSPTRSVIIPTYLIERGSGELAPPPTAR